MAGGGRSTSHFGTFHGTHALFWTGHCRRRNQLLSDRSQAGQCEQRGDVRRTFSQAAESRLHKHELALDDMQRVLDLRRDAGLAEPALPGSRPHATPGHLGHVAWSGSDSLLEILTNAPSCSASVTGIGSHLLLLAVQQVGHQFNVGFTGQGGGYGVHQAAVSFPNDVRLQPEEPLVALHGRVHLRITFAFGVLREERPGNDRGVRNGASLEKQTLASLQRVGCLEDVFGQVAGLEQVSEVLDGRLVQDRRVEALTRDATKRGNLLQCILHRRVALRKSALRRCTRRIDSGQYGPRT